MMLSCIASGKCANEPFDRTLLRTELVEERDKLEAKERYDRPLPEPPDLSDRKLARGRRKAG